ncbi:unnamed protein product, partial [Closterium sp. NIES-53]
MTACRIPRYDARGSDEAQPAAAAPEAAPTTAATIRTTRPATNTGPCRGDDAEYRETVLRTAPRSSQSPPAVHGSAQHEPTTPRCCSTPTPFEAPQESAQSPPAVHGSAQQEPSSPRCFSAPQPRGARMSGPAPPVGAAVLLLLLPLLLHGMGWQGAMAQATLNDDEWPAMKEMKAALSFSGRDTWVQGAVCTTMTGVTCDASGYVTRIKVPDFSGSLPAAIGDLIHLNYLFCVSDRLTGPLPNSISKLTNLQSL